jgi:hypothetical protein
MGTATRITDINEFTTDLGVQNKQAGYKLDPPYEGNEYVFLSEAYLEVKDLFTIDETMLFPATPDGSKLSINYGEPLYTLNERSFSECLEAIGYTIAGEQE